MGKGDANSNKALSREELPAVLQHRFEKHMHRHEGLDWKEIEAKLQGNPAKLESLHQMEQTGGEPDVVWYDEKEGGYVFVDCAAESPAGRRSVCYDRKALESRKKYKPENSAVDMAEEMGIDILTEEAYRALQQIGEFDLKTSSWVQTPADIRERGGALFCDRRFGHVFVYHSGAESYYGARGFRGSLIV
ncbi:DUF4256 domain-containing protein [Salibacterium halotolerans]|uniref:DUF4256 domain-containing protein n=1 Tax=Salibacterium halotolerans TaxID=1884432 RepID=A0A1I5PJY3_9BACI|nr:DUF4256 domain-containing protein [Salibacterium halotolerans]SFP34404.1 Protein of unknown function [Salibacterium halotolerans]